MQPSTRLRVVSGLLVASVLLNAAFLVVTLRSGGLRRALVKLDVVAVPPPPRMPFQRELEAKFRKLPNAPGEVIVAGDSLVADGPWSEFYTDLRSRGIGGDTTAGLLGRLDEITEGRPRKVVLLIGANDLADAVPIPVYLRNYRTILDRIRAESPATAIVVLGILPINLDEFPKKLGYRNATVIEANLGLKALVAETPGVRFLDLADRLVDARGNLRRDLSTDGLHLNLDGYLALRQALRPAVLGEAGPVKP